MAQPLNVCRLQWMVDPTMSQMYLNRKIIVFLSLLSGKHPPSVIIKQQTMCWLVIQYYQVPGEQNEVFIGHYLHSLAVSNYSTGVFTYIIYYQRVESLTP